MDAVPVPRWNRTGLAAFGGDEGKVRGTNNNPAPSSENRKDHGWIGCAQKKIRKLSA